MAEDIVVKEQLTNELNEVGAQLIAQLDAVGLPMVAAFWFFSSETNEWRLLIASPERSVHGPQGIYRKIREAREALGEKAAALPLSLVSLIAENDELVQAFRAIPAGEGISRKRFTKEVVNRRYIDDALVYRIA